ncbi:hypothetical protein [Vibrio phage D4]|nr:hypothetical protein [Vibrio phage D4]
MTVRTFIILVVAILVSFIISPYNPAKEDLDPQAAAMRDRIEWVKTYHGQDSVAPPVIIPPYTIGTGIDVTEFTPATMPNHRCVFIHAANESGLYCSDIYGGLNHARTN